MTDPSQPRLYLLLENPSKGNNLGALLRCAVAHGIDTIVVVGYDKCAVDGKMLSFVTYQTQ